MVRIVAWLTGIVIGSSTLTFAYYYVFAGLEYRRWEASGDPIHPGTSDWILIPTYIGFGICTAALLALLVCGIVASARAGRPRSPV